MGPSTASRRPANGINTVWREGYANDGQQQARPDPTRLGHHPHPVRPRAGGDHRQRGPHPRGGHAPRAQHRREAPHGVRHAGVQPRRELRRPVPHSRQPLAHRREQLRLHRSALGPVRPHHAAGPRARRRPPRPQRLPEDLALGGAGALGGAEGLARRRAGLHLHEARGRRQGPLVPHRPGLPQRAHGLEEARRLRARAQQQLRAGHRQSRQRDRLRGHAGRAGRPARPHAPQAAALAAAEGRGALREPPCPRPPERHRRAARAARPHRGAQAQGHRPLIAVPRPLEAAPHPAARPGPHRGPSA